MNIQESLQTALRSLRANKARSGLTMLGIIIGVAAVIALLAIGHGAQAVVTEQIQGIGSNLLFVMPKATQQGGVQMDTGIVQTLTYEDALAIASPLNCPNVARVAPQLGRGVQIVYKGESVQTQLVGTTADFAIVRNFQLAEGEFFSPSHVSGRSLVAVLGPDTAEALFGSESALDKSIRVNNITFRVIGVLAAKGGGSFGSEDDQVIVPLTTAALRLGRQQVRGGTAVVAINVQAISDKAVEAAAEEIRTVLRERHRLRFEDDFQILSQTDILSLASQVTGVLTIFLGGIAAISLLVGGIGIMNIMLVSVTERTREIGIRKAVGAKRRDILMQFLTEAVVLSIAGGLLGILLGWGLSSLVERISTASGTPIPVTLTPSSIALACGFSIAVGLFFGIYPAARAASLNPIDALRYE